MASFARNNHAMYKKIICPVDFSKASNNGVEYAANLAKAMGAELHLLNVKSLYPVEVVPAGVWMESDAIIATDILKKMVAETIATFDIVCSYEIDVTRESFGEAISTAAGDNSLVVMGTNGVDGFYQYLFGSNTYNVVKKAKCPVLVVPEDFSFEGITKMVFAWDHNADHKLSFDGVKRFLDTFKQAKVVVLNISKAKTSTDDTVFTLLKEEMKAKLGADYNRVEFTQVQSDATVTRMNIFMADSKADLLVLTNYEHEGLMQYIRPSVVKIMTSIPRFAVLVVHS